METGADRMLVVRFNGNGNGGREKVSAKLLDRLGLGEESSRRWYSPGLLCVGLDKPLSSLALRKLKALPGIERIAFARAGGLHARAEGRRTGVSRAAMLGSARVGGGGLAVIAGPCSVESREQLLKTARLVSAQGACALRGGAFKPRTSPYDFGGLGERALEYLAEAREKTGLAVVTEVLDARDLDLVSRYADGFQIGARNMHNSALLYAAGSHPSGKTILLKRGFCATIEEFLQAAEYVLLGRLAAGREPGGLILCERGIRTFERSTRFTLDLGALAVLRERTWLPIIADPSHAAGARRWVAPLARAAVAAGTDGLLIEVHPDPERALSDGEQSLGPAEFRAMMRELRELEPLSFRRAARVNAG